jgi:hypothetical protein
MNSRFVKACWVLGSSLTVQKTSDLPLAWTSLNRLDHQRMIKELPSLSLG